jgi:hypothetical protein
MQFKPTEIEPIEQIQTKPNQIVAIQTKPSQTKPT